MFGLIQAERISWFEPSFDLDSRNYLSSADLQGGWVGWPGKPPGLEDWDGGRPATFVTSRDLFILDGISS